MAGRLIVLVAILTSLLLAGEGCHPYPKDPVPDCCLGYDGRTSAAGVWPDSQSPAGGPSNNTGAVVCYFYRTSNCLVCSLGLSVSKCCALPPKESDDTVQPNGPAPFNEYLIGKYYSNLDYSGIEWHNLYPRKEYDRGYYGYNQPTMTGRSQMAIYREPFGTSERCMAMEGDYFWQETMGLLGRGSMTYLDLDGNSDKKKEYSGFLYVVI